MELTFFNRIGSRCNRASCRCPFKSGFIFLLTMTFLLFAMVYVTDFSLKKAVSHVTLYKKVFNQIRSHYLVIEFPPDGNNRTIFLAPAPKANQQVQESATPNITQTTANSVHYHVAHPVNYHFIMDEPDRCEQKNPFLVLMVPVAPKQISARNAIRSTWGNESTVQGKTVLTLFVVGLTLGPLAEKIQEQLEEESREYRDIIQSNFVDSYFNLTIKTMVIMDWLATRCPQANYSMKVDSDMFINVENLMNLLLAPKTPRENYITGVLMRNRPVVRNKHSKWYVSEELYPEPRYPTYLLGMAYLFSNDMPEKIVEISKEVKAFNNEDAYVGACLNKLGIKPSSPPEPSRFRIYMGQYNRENFLRVITTILNSPQQLINIWNDIKKEM